jgi:hypothetical protein
MAVETARRRVTTAALPGARKTAAETETSLGGGVARARGEGAARVWSAVRDAAAPVERMGQEMFRQIQTEARQQADEVALLKARNRLSTARNALLYDPNTGALNRKGEAAMETPNQVSSELERVSGEIEADLHTDEQRAAFRRMYADERNTIDLTLQRHVSQEMTEFRNRELVSTVSNAKNAAVLAAQDPTEIQRQLAIATDAIATNAPRLGLGAEQVQEQIAAVKSEVHVGVIRNLAASGQDKKAQAYYQEVNGRGEIAGTSKDEIENLLEVASSQGEGLRSSREIWATLGPKSDKDPIEFDKMEEEVAKRYGDDPKTYQAAMAYLRERKASVDAARKDREETIAGGLWKKAAGGASLEQLQRSPEYLDAPGRVQAQITDYIVGKREREASRAAAEEGRAFTRENRQQAAKERKGWARYWELSDPETLSKMTDNQIEMLRGDLGDDHVNRLMTQRRTAEKNEATVREATIDDDLFKTIAHGAGLPAFNASSEDDKVQLGQLKADVERQIDAEQRATGKPLTRDRKEVIMRSTVDHRVMISSWGFDKERIAATVVNPEDRSRAYVPIERIPQATIGQYLNYARSLNQATQRMSDQELQARFGDRIQRAYGLRLLGATTAEIQAAMQGK